MHVHGWSSCLAALGDGIFKQAGIILHTSVFSGRNLTFDLLPGRDVAPGVPHLCLLPELAGDVGVGLVLEVIVRSSISFTNNIIELVHVLSLIADDIMIVHSAVVELLSIPFHKLFKSDDFLQHINM